ncbi:M3 family peptidase [Candidatus Bathyarchaeota archaeon]|nr:MAG: M3 family peptidase [Candidatus Bathyarchaeota archaeon]
MEHPDNPLLVCEGIPRFDLIKPEHIEPAVSQVLEEAEKKITELESTIEPTWSGLIKPLERLSLPFEYAWSPIGHLLNVKNSKELREEHQKMQPKVVQFSLRAGQSRPIYDGLIAIRDGTEWDNLDDHQKRVINLKIRDAKHYGVGLSGDAKKRFNEISTELSRLSTDFMNHVLDSTKAYEFIITEKKDTEGWPNNLIQLASQSFNSEKKTDDSTPEYGPWRITLEAPVIVPFLKHSRRRDQREKLLRAYSTRADSGEWDNQPLIARILLLRKELAALLEFDSFADLSIDSKMAPSVVAVFDMLDELFTASKPHQVKEFNDLEKIASDGGQVEPLNHWDTGFWSERLKEKLFDFTDDELRPYFPMPKVLDGMFKLTEFLFGVMIQEADGEAPVWNPDIKYYKVYEAGKQVASFYTDVYSRPAEKRGGAWMDNCLDRRVIDGKVRLPVVYLNANGTPPVGDKPSLMSFDEVTTIFHEFGHCLQGMLTTVDIADVSGINGVEWDAVEICSQFMENWCYHEPILRTISGHWETGEPLPDHYVEKLRKTRVYMAASAMVRQLEFGLTDMTLHSSFDPEGEETAFDVHERIAEKTKVIPPMKDDHFLCAFSHIFAGGYAAGYYSYKWAEVLSTDLFSAFEEVGLENDSEVKRLGKQFRESFLALGGSVEPMKIFKAFMGREPSTEALLRHSDLL